MFRYSLSWYIFTFTLLELIVRTHLTIHDSTHGFISKNPRYFDDELSNIHEEITTNLRLNELSLKMQLKFEPSFLDFKQRPLGVPHMERVTLFNIDNKSIDMTSISGNTVHFHSSFFEDKRIPPMGNTTFNVVFLGREEGFVESNLFIHTSEGHIKYNVKGASTFSHYRLRPIVGIKLPLNSSFSPLIYMHNPHSQPIQIVEIYSSGGDFHLELPSGEQEGPNDMWEIPPQHTKAIIRVRFHAKVVQNHTAYVRIKLNKPNEILVVPLEVEVTSSVGIFHPQGSVDFGIGGSLDAPKQIKVCVHNPLRKPIRIHSVSTTSKAMSVDYENVKISPELKSDKRENSCINIGTVTINWQKAYEIKDYSGKIMVKFRNGKYKSEIPYYVTVLKGGLSYNPIVTTYFINDKINDIPPRNFKMKNDFETAVQILNVTISNDAQNLFIIENINPQILKPKEERNIFKISLQNNVDLNDIQVNSNIILQTNISDILIPLLSYNGKLHVHLPFKSKDYSLDLGLISFDAKKEVYFLIVNHNPVDIDLKSIKSSIPMTSAEVYGCGNNDYKLALFQVSFKNLTKCIHLKPNSYALIKLLVQTSNAEGQIWGDVQIETQFENLSVPVHFKIAPGKLEIGPDRLVFDQCFPGKICSHPLRVHSTFNDPMVIEDIISLPPDKRISSKHSGHILARATKVIGHLYLNPNIECNNECYTGLQHDTTAQWLKTFSLSKYVADFDMHLLNVFYNRYINLTSNGLKKWQNLTLRLDTTEVRGHVFKTRVKMSWPSLLLEQNIENRSLFTFPLTQVGNVTYKNITIKNPSSYNLMVQLVLDKDYPNREVLFDGLPSNFIPYSSDGSSSRRFFFLDNERYLDMFGESFDLKVSEESLPILLYPGQNVSITIGFRGEDTNVHTALMFIRNNLTILEVIRLKGQGAYPHFKFGNRKPGSPQPLSFEMTDKHLKDCERERHPINASPNLTVKRSFTARNIGDITIFINSFHVNDFPCEGYGFKVVNCVPFMLPPNATKKIDIAFTPDLTLTKVSRMLIMGTSLNFPVNYTLFTTFPPQYLNKCSALISRPFWEVYLYYMTIILMITIFIIIISVAIMDAEKIKKHALSTFKEPATMSVQPVLNLRLVGEQTREEIRSFKVEPEPPKEESKERDKSVEKVVPEPEPAKVVMPEEEVKTKLEPEPEPEKYSVLIPTVGKAKKRLSKKNSNDLENEMQKKVSEVVKPGKTKGEPIKFDEKKYVKEKKSTFNNKHKHTKNTYVPAYEEETSSTTTDSSSNNEDTEKDNQRHVRVSSKKPSNKVEICTKIIDDVQLPDNKLSGSVTHKVDRHKNNLKVLHKPGKDETYQKAESANMKTVREKKSNKNVKERKEKQLNKKNYSEKNAKSTSGESTHVSPVPRVSPSIAAASTAPIWGETRAKFSDVVARNDNMSTTRPLSQNNVNSKPTMYVEPYKQTTQELGPIGSRRMDFWQDTTALSQNSNRDVSNSYFTNSQDIRLDNGSAGFLTDFNAMNNWNQEQNFVNILEANACNDNISSTSSDDPWGHNLLNSNEYWSNNFSPLLEETAPVPQTAATNQPAGYLWGSSPVWQPWAPAQVTRTPTRTPPGFDEFLQRKRDEPPQQPPRDSYSPFNTSNIWTNPQTGNPWNYQGQ